MIHCPAVSKKTEPMRYPMKAPTIENIVTPSASFFHEDDLLTTIGIMRKSGGIGKKIDSIHETKYRIKDPYLDCDANMSLSLNVFFFFSHFTIEYHISIKNGFTV